MRPSYEQDFHAWALDQAARLREQACLRRNEPIDWEMLAEEVEDLGRSERHACESLVEQILAHLLKLQLSSFVQPRRHWEAEIAAARVALERKLTPSIERHLLVTLPDRYRTARRLLDKASVDVEPDLVRRAPADYPYELTQVIGRNDWLPQPAGESTPTASA
jgi:hypothetical protein